MLHHVSLYVTDYQKSKEFYLAALAPLGYALVMEHGEVGGFGAEGKPDLWVVKSDKPIHRQHLAFAAHSKEIIAEFHKSGLEAGGTDNGGPGPREMYSPTYFGAFVNDPDGNNIEAVLVV